MKGTLCVSFLMENLQIYQTSGLQMTLNMKQTMC